MDKELLSMADASKICPYEKGYLSLLARRGELHAEKIGRNWYTKVEWLNEYLEKKRPNDIIVNEKRNASQELNKKEKSLFRIVFAWMISSALIVLVGIWIFGRFSEKITDIEKNVQGEFIPQEIVKIPDEQGNFDVYGIGKMKLGKEKVDQ